MTESSFRHLLLRFAYVPVVSLCFFLGALGLQLNQIDQLRLHSSNAMTAMVQSERLLKNAIDEETGIRGYLLSKDPSFLQIYRTAASDRERELAALKQAAPATPSLAPKIAAIEQSLNRFDAVNQQLLSPEPRAPETVTTLLEQQKQVMDSLRANLGDVVSQQGKIREKDGKDINALLNSLPANGIWGGALIAALLIWHGIYLYQDITGAFRQQLTERELQRDSLQTTLHSIGDAVIVCDSSSKITLMNRTAEEITGWLSGNAIGRPLNDVFRAIDENARVPVESPVDKVRRLNRAVSPEYNTAIVRRDGAEIPIDESGAPIRDRNGALSGVVLIFRSVAEERRAAKALRESEERFRSIYQTSLEYIGILDPDGRVLDCNRASLEFASNAREEIIGSYYWDCPWFIFTPGMPDLVRDAVRRGAAGFSTLTEMSLARPTGEIVHFDFSITPVFGADGKVIFLVPEARDITELKYAERALVQSEKLAAVGRLASSIAHEINNPLEAVTNLLYLARQSESQEQLNEYLQMADAELRRVSVIANQTLRFHKQTSKPQPIEAADLCETVLSIYEGKLKNSQITVESLHRAKEPIVCFAGDVRQVLNNLVGNAIDAMNPGGRLLIRSNTATDWATSRRGIVFTVADTGHGISPADRKKIFEPFYTTKGFGGTGLGLWVSKEVVARHNGALNLRSSQANSHSGTIFRFFLPFADSQLVAHNQHGELQEIKTFSG